MKKVKQQLRTPNIIKEKTFQLSIYTIKLVRSLSNNPTHQVLGKQLLRSATSIGANVVEAQAGRTKRDFTNYYHIALKSANETKYWLQLIAYFSKKTPLHASVINLLRQTNDVGNILGASLLTLKGKRST